MLLFFEFSHFFSCFLYCSTFVKQSFTKRSNYAIRYYEKQFPGCAVELIGLGISYFKTLGDLTAEEMFTIFSHLYRTPHYQTSIFRELC